ncbi:MAG: N-acetylglucosamine-6-phosphate deacetylase [Halioglobus sp.]
MTTAVCARQLFDGERWLADHALILKDDLIQAVLPAKLLPADITKIDLGNGTLAPGLIDIQVNGGGDVMLNNQPTADGVQRIAAGHRRFGTTGLLPTVISDTRNTQQAAATAVGQARANGSAGVLGLHIEGPFFDMQRRGTHNADMIRPMEDADIQWLTKINEFPVVLTLAPEHTVPGQMRQLADAGLLLCAGHTDADYDCIQAAIAEGLRGFTHLFNAMKPLTSREPGTVGAALESPDTWAGIIVDGHHVHPATIRLALRTKAPGKLLLVSDAMSTVGGKQDSFEIYGERIAQRDGRLVNAEGNLAGSAIALIDAVRIGHEQVGIELGECLRMASLYPAQFLKLEHQLGRLQEGFRADMMCFTSNYAVTDTWVAGEHQRHAEQ